jgi:serine/threonine-protein kinase ATR
MARNGGIASQRLAPPQIANGQLPPSTAARIVTHAANAQDHPQPGEDERFIEIVQEYLDDDEDDSNPNPQTNIAVISALMGKGFDNFHKTLEQNPFDQAQPLNITIICIKAITKIIGRKPHLLLHPQSEENDGSPRPPVFLWMFPRLIDFVGKPNMESLQGHLCGLLGFCLDVLTRKWSLWQPSVSFTKLYLSCVDGTSSL